MPLGETCLEAKQVRALELDLFGRDERSGGDAKTIKIPRSKAIKIAHSGGDPDPIAEATN